MESEICLCSLPKHCVSEDWTFSVRPEWHLSQSSLSRVVSPFPSVPKSSSKLCSSLGQIHRKTEIKQTPHICSRCSHYHDLLRMILLIWISTIGKTVQLSHLMQKIPWDLHTSSLPCKMRSPCSSHLFPPLQVRSPCSHPWVAGTAVASGYWFVFCAFTFAVFPHILFKENTTFEKTGGTRWQISVWASVLWHWA